MAIIPRPFSGIYRGARTDDDPTSGILLLIGAAILIPISDSFAKILASDLPAMQIVWLRYALQTALVLPLALWWHGRRLFRVAHPFAQIIRSVLIAGAAFCFFSAVRTISIADAVAVFFINPFIVTALSPIVLGERVGIYRWFAVCAGFIGTLVVVRPGFADVDVGTVFALGAGTCFALFVLVTRRLAKGDPPLVTTFLTGLGAFVISSLAAPFVWVPVTASHAMPIFAMGAIGCVFSILVVLAYERASASQLAPFGYTEIAAAALVGWIAFGDMPDAISWVGIAIIVSSGIFIAWREAVRGVVP